MRVLIVGAGAVGQVYGAALSRGGADVVVHVRARHADDARRGYRLARIGMFGRRAREDFKPSQVLVDAERIARERFDQAWICVATPALEDGALDAVLGSLGAATVVTLQPGLEAAAQLARRIDPARIVSGVIGFLSYASPLAGSDDPRERGAEPQTAYFVPPGTKTKLGGPERRALDALGALRAGGLPAELVRDARAELALSTAQLMPFVAAVELSDWSFSRCARSELVPLAVDAAREATRVTTTELGCAVPTTATLMAAPMVRMGLLAAPRMAPFDVEAYLRFHFTKVGEQTLALLDELVARADRQGFEAPALQRLVRDLTEKRRSCRGTGV